MKLEMVGYHRCRRRRQLFTNAGILNLQDKHNGQWKGKIPQDTDVWVLDGLLPGVCTL